MKIAFITTYDFAVPGGVRNHIIQLGNEFIRQGHSVSVIAPSSEQIIDEFNGVFIPITTFPSASKTGLIPPHLLVGFRVIKRMQATLNSEVFDIVHIHEPLLPPLCLSTLILTQVPLFATFHTYYEKGQPLYRLFQPILNRWLNRLQGRIAVSNSAKAYIEQYFPYDYQVIPNGVNIEKFSSPMPPLAQLTPGYFNILFVGHAQFKRKGLRYLLEAFHSLKPKYPKLRLFIAGARWVGRSFALENENDIVYLGTVTDKQLISLYQTADIFCAPSTGNESFGMVLIEAMAAGIPIVTTNINGYQNVVRHEENALIVPAKNSTALANAIRRLIHDPVLRAMLSQQGKISIECYDWQNIAYRVMSYYQISLNSEASSHRLRGEESS